MARAEMSHDGDAPSGRAHQRYPERSELHDDVTRAVLPANRNAPGAARKLLGFCFAHALGAGALSDAQLLISELVTNSLVHGELGDGASIVVRMHLHTEALRLEVHNRGSAGSIAANGGDPGRSRGHGLDIVRSLGTRWGVLRGMDTCVWVDAPRT